MSEAIGSLDRAVAHLAERDVYKSRRWLAEFLNKTPTDGLGRPLYRLAGRDKRLSRPADLGFAMPLKIVTARNKKTKTSTSAARTSEWALTESAKTDRGSVARAILKRLEGAIERGEYPPRETGTRSDEPTFLTAANAYMEAGRPARYVAPLIKYFGETPIVEIDQAAIDAAAVAMVPNGTPINRTRLIYTPVSAILHHAGDKRPIRRPRDPGPHHHRLAATRGCLRHYLGGGSNRSRARRAFPIPALHRAADFRRA